MSYCRSRGPGFHHICLEVDDIDEMLEKLQIPQRQTEERKSDRIAW